MGDILSLIIVKPAAFNAYALSHLDVDGAKPGDVVQADGQSM